jgi:amino acid transporter
VTTIQAVPAARGGTAAAEHEPELKHNTLSLFDTTVIATSSVAPAYTLAATVAFIVAFVGLASPAAILIAFIPVLFIAISYYYLNRMDPNCGASYSWVSRVLSPHAGWLSGWVQLAANVLFCASAPIIAGTYTMQLLQSIFPGQISADAASNKYLIAVIGIAWLALTTFMVVRGIRITANFQWALVAIEVLIILGFAIYAIVKVASGTAVANHVSASWFNPASTDVASLAGGVALGVFFFWGWDTAANVNEESKSAEENPGRAGVISMFILLGIFLVVAVAVQETLSLKALNNPDNQNDILYFFSQQIASSPITYLMILAVLSSTVAVIQTTLLPSSRLSFSMARDGVFPRAFGIVHSRWHTPWVGTLLSSALATAIILLTLFLDSVNNVFANLILDIGVLVAFYYGLTGIACAWAFRKLAMRSLRMFLFAGLLPLVGGLALFAVAGYVVYNDVQSAIPVLVTMGVGLPLLAVAVVTNRNGFFRQKQQAYVELAGRPQAVAAAE